MTKTRIDTPPVPPRPAASEMPLPRCQVCGVRLDVPPPTLCPSCGEPVLRLGWAP
ncbi:MAG: hypothetical protein HY216_05645 [Candidatus Rokubacteria bacterium]|nr:hypothetical protein [Candidatus Rokubacteria bacterium]